MKKLTPALTASILVAISPLEAIAEYLNDSNMTVLLGSSMAPEPFVNRSTADSLASVIDADSPEDYEFHSQTTSYLDQ